MRPRPLVVVPQLAGSQALVRPFTDALPRELPVIVLEPPGCGASASPRGVPSTRRLAEAVLDAWDRRGLGRAHLFGISIGGMIAQWMAIDAPGLVDRLVLASTAAQGVRIVREAGFRPLRLARCLLVPGSDTASCLAEKVAADAERALLDPVREQPRSKADLVWLAAAAATHDARRALSGVRSPTLILTGERDWVIRPETQAHLVELLPRARQEHIPACAHDLTLEQPTLCARHVAAFLTGATP